MCNLRGFGELEFVGSGGAGVASTSAGGAAPAARAITKPGRGSLSARQRRSPSRGMSSQSAISRRFSAPGAAPSVHSSRPGPACESQTMPRWCSAARRSTTNLGCSLGDSCAGRGDYFRPSRFSGVRDDCPPAAGGARIQRHEHTRPVATPGLIHLGPNTGLQRPSTRGLRRRTAERADTPEWLHGGLTRAHPRPSISELASTPARPQAPG
jgi:hypothetical protein